MEHWQLEEARMTEELNWKLEKRGDHWWGQKAKESWHCYDFDCGIRLSAPGRKV
jgi:hypothetical protein